MAPKGRCWRCPRAAAAADRSRLTRRTAQERRRSPGWSVLLLGQGARARTCSWEDLRAEGAKPRLLFVRIRDRDDRVPAQATERWDMRQDPLVELLQRIEERRDLHGVRVDLLPVPLLVRIYAIPGEKLQKHGQRGQPKLTVSDATEGRLKHLDVLERERLFVWCAHRLGDLSVHIDHRVVRQRLDEAGEATRPHDSSQL